jgi:hypothetical protein
LCAPTTALTARSGHQSFFTFGPPTESPRKHLVLGAFAAVYSTSQKTSKSSSKIPTSWAIFIMRTHVGA